MKKCKTTYRAVHSKARSGVALSALAVILSVAVPHSAWAKAEGSQGDASDERSGDKEIVVTGTLLRGVEPVGTQALTVQADQILATGASDASQLLTNIPQAGTFNTQPAVRGQDGIAKSINRPILRNLGNPAASSSSTLLLVDGHRLPGMGITQTGPDVDAIPTGAIERVEIVPDGGSSTYGSDAIGGVINFIVRKRFDGVAARANYGFADNYHQFTSSVTIGKDWGSGSAYIAYDYSHNSSIYGRDRSWFNGLDWTNTQKLGVPVGNDTNCQPGNIQVGSTFFALPNRTTDANNLGNRCDLNKASTLYPSETRHSLLGRIILDNGGPLSFSLTGFYMHRKDVSDLGPLRNSGGFRVASSNPYFVPLVARATSEMFLFNLSPVFGNSSYQTSTIETFGITPAVRAELGDKWQVNAFANYGEGDSSFVGEILNPTPITTAITAGTFDPSNLTAATNAATLATARDWFNYARGRNKMFNARLVFDGTAFTLPGGDVKVAVGGEFIHESFALNSRNGVTGAGIASLATNSAKRDVYSLFGEINIPIIGAGNGGAIHSLSVSASGRYDHYSDFGNTFNPKFGVTFEPVDWIKLRGNYAKSFQAPSLNDLASASVSSATVVSNSAGALAFFGDPDVPATAPFRDIIFFSGTITPLKPQTARSYSLGIDLTPPAVKGLGLGVTYYNIKFKNLIDSAPIGQGNLFFDNFPSQYAIYTQGLTQVQAYLDQVRALVNNPQVLPATAGTIYAILDQRKQNLAGVFTDGLDIYLRYRHQTGFGAVYLDFNGNYMLHFKRQLSPAAPFVEVTTGNSTADVARWRTTTTLGTEIGNLRAQVTWNFVEGYDVVPITYGPGLVQTKVGSYNLFNLFFEYKVPGESKLLKNLAFTLNIDNVFDQDPPLYRGSQGFANGQTLGRVIKIGVSKAF